MTLTSTIDETVSKSFRTALLLTGSSFIAEAATLDAIHSEDPDQVQDGRLLRAAIVAAMAMGFSDMPELDEVSSILPLELRRVLRLPAELRRCFVLRILAGLSGEECSHLLDMSIGLVDERTRAAASELVAIRQTESRDSAGLAPGADQSAHEKQIPNLSGSRNKESTRVSEGTRWAAKRLLS
jgi:hypothetical protein